MCIIIFVHQLKTNNTNIILHAKKIIVIGDLPTQHYTRETESIGIWISVV